METISKKTGVDIAKKLDWNGKKICDAFLTALTESNFHDLKMKIEAIINEEDNNAQLKYFVFEILDLAS